MTSSIQENWTKGSGGQKGVGDKREWGKKEREEDELSEMVLMGNVKHQRNNVRKGNENMLAS